MKKIFLFFMAIFFTTPLFAEDLSSKFVGHVWSGQIPFIGMEMAYKFEKNGTAYVISITTKEGNNVKKTLLPATLDKDKGIMEVYNTGSGLFKSGNMVCCVLSDGSLLMSDGNQYQVLTTLPDWAK